MMPLILSLVTAGLFLLLSGLTYGGAALLASPWVAMVFWGTLAPGAMLFLLSHQDQGSAR